MLLGRSAERLRLDALLDAAVAGRGEPLVLRGETGIGKTALLQEAAGRARDRGFAVVEARGVETEAELPFAALADLLGPLLPLLDGLPAPQAAALRGALALGPPQPGDRFAVAAGTLALLAAGAERQPLLVSVDDAHRVDAASLEAVAFAARRVRDTPVAFLFAAAPDGPAVLDGLAALPLAGLDGAAAAELVGGGVAASVAQRLAAGTHGNPLALRELAATLTEAELNGRAPLPEPLPAVGVAERAFRGRLEALAPPAQHAALLAAAAGPAPAAAVLAAAAALGIPEDAFDDLERAGLVAVADARISFVHRLAQSVAYESAPAPERRRAHRALAGALTGERRARHLGLAALGPDEAAAAALDQAASAAEQRGAYAAAAASFRRAADLSTAADGRRGRLLAAAEAARRAGALEDALQTLAEARETAPEAAARGLCDHLRGRIELFAGRAAAAQALLASAASDLADADDARAATALAESALAAMLAGDVGASVEAAVLAHAGAAAEGELVAKLILGTTLFHAGVVEDGFALLVEAARLAEDAAAGAFEPEYVVFAALALTWAGQHGRARAILTRTIAGARAAGALGLLPFALYAGAYLDVRSGRLAAAAAAADEAAELAAATGAALWRFLALGCLALVRALRGDEASCRAFAREARELAARLEIEYPRDDVDALGLLELGLGRPEAAVRHLEAANRIGRDSGLPAFARPSAPDLVEAYVRAGLPLAAELRSAIDDGVADGAFAAHGAALLRCRGLVAAGVAGEACFREALRLHALVDSPLEQARTQLVHGELLRRSRRRVEAREQLRASVAAFEEAGAEPWAARARAELAATGERLAAREGGSVEELTPQELRIAELVARGATNREAGAALFVSPKTVEMHLSRVYRKLGVRSRAELAARLAHAPPAQV